MLLSMTGFGEAPAARRPLDRSRSKCARSTTATSSSPPRSASPTRALEPEIERLVRETIRRGTVQLSLRVERPRRAEDYRLNTVALASYRDQLRALEHAERCPRPRGAAAGLPGVVEEQRPRRDRPARRLARALGRGRREALRRLQALARRGRPRDGRRAAGAGPRRSPSGSSGSPTGRRMSWSAYQRAADRAGPVARRSDKGVTIEPKDLIREVAILAERADIAEEIVRLRAHLDQYERGDRRARERGRKLEFVVQEMGRETNTIGSKANDVEISREVVEIKGAPGEDPRADPERRMRLPERRSVDAIDGRRSAIGES